MRLHLVSTVPFALIIYLFCLPASGLAQQPTTVPVADWQTIVRASPYWISRGSFTNLSTIRRWVLTGSAYCEKADRHILFDRNARFLGFFSDAGDSVATQVKLNAYRAQLAQQSKVTTWVAGDENRSGYPFALSCAQPYANLDESWKRYSGEIAEARLWGTWDGISIGSPQSTVSLHHALQHVFHNRKQFNRISLPEDILSTLAGKILIESGARPRAQSTANAKGILQLSPAALGDCELAPQFHFHRIAQIDCAFKLLEQNHRLLQADFMATFSHLPQSKKDELYAYLLLQAYHGGIGRVRDLMLNSEFNGAALYFAKHHRKFSAGDIALGLIYHNLGRNQLGFSSLYYVVDVGIAKEYACQQTPDLAGCDL